MHSVVTGGGVSPCGKRWIHARHRFLLSVRVLSRLFRRLFLEALEQAHAAGELEFHGQLDRLRDPEAFRQHLAPLRRTEWVVYLKPPFGGAAQVIDYLGRYTHRVAIGEQRLVDARDGEIRFLYKDYASLHSQQNRVMTLQADEFLRRFLLHVLPEGFQRIRYYGLFSNRNRASNLALCRSLLVGVRSHLLPSPEQLHSVALIVETAQRCPVCKTGTMHRTYVIAPQYHRPLGLDSS